MVPRPVQMLYVLLACCVMHQASRAESRFTPDRLYAGFYASGFMHDRVEKRGVRVEIAQFASSHARIISSTRLEPTRQSQSSSDVMIVASYTRKGTKHTKR